MGIRSRLHTAHERKERNALKVFTCQIYPSSSAQLCKQRALLRSIPVHYAALQILA